MNEPLAVLGDSLALTRQRGSAGSGAFGSFDVGPLEFEALLLTEALPDSFSSPSNAMSHCLERVS